LGLAVVVLPGFGSSTDAVNPSGLWKTIDDKTGRPRGTVRIYEENGAFFGKIEATVDPAEAKKRCGLCKGERKDKPVIGLLILRNMKGQGGAGEFGGGDILDPDTGFVYRCNMRLTSAGGKLVLRGYIGFSLLGRSQTWIRETVISNSHNR
jgi:uncharacterized protein (DUF2147 family)